MISSASWQGIQPDPIQFVNLLKGGPIKPFEKESINLYDQIYVFLCDPGATSAPCLIFIFPAVFYIRIVPREDEPMTSTSKILVRHKYLLLNTFHDLFLNLDI